MQTIYNAHRYSYTVHINNDTYLILFGNREEGWECTKEELKEYWSKAIRMSKYKTFGDVTLLYKGKLIRAGHNLNKKITNKSIRYPCHYTKHPYQIE